MSVRESSRGSRPYKVLCVSALHPKSSNDVVRDSLYREYKQYGDISVRVVEEPEERVAYVYFRNFEDASEARHAKSRIILYDKPAVVEPVFESRPEARSRPRSMSPPPPSYPRYRSRSPPVRSDHHHREYREDYHHQPHYQPHHHSSRGGYQDHYHHREQHYPRGRGRGGYHPRGDYHHHTPYYQPRGRGGPPRHYEGGARPDYKKERFPDYLTHIPPEDDPKATRTLFAGNLELNITEEEMKKIFGRYGKLVDIDVKRPPPGTGNAFAFVRYENLNMAHRAKVELSGQFIGKFQCKIGYGKANATPKVWVGSLGSWCSESLLWKEFDRFGAIKSIEYTKGDTQAFILYEMVDAAQAAVQEMRGFPLGGPEKRLRIDFSDVDAPVEGDASPQPEGSKRTSFSSRSFEEPGRSNGYRRRDSRPEDRERSRSGEPDDRELVGAQTISEICRKTSRVWDGGLILKNSLFPTGLHLIDGSREIVDILRDEDGKNNLKITQRLRLDQGKLDDVSRRMTSASSHAVFLGIPASMSIEHASPEIQSRPLRNLVTYLKQKEAAGVISLTYREQGENSQGVLYCFPPCEFASDLLHRNACDMVEDGKEDYLLVVVVCGS